jgi:hypothetical protein
MKKKPLPPFSYSRPTYRVIMSHLNKSVVNFKYLLEGEEVEMNATLREWNTNVYRPEANKDLNIIQVWDADNNRWTEFDHRQLTEWNGGSRNGR